MTVYTTDYLSRVVASLVEPSAFLLDLCFGEVEMSDTEQISFDVENRKRRITPLVSPLVAGQVVEREAFETKTFTPGYAKDKRQFDPLAPMRRRMGEQLDGTDSPDARRRYNLNRALGDQERMLTRLEETFAAEILRTGKLTISGKGFGTYQIDFGRAAALTVAALTGQDLWTDQTNSTPLDDIEGWGQLIQDESGAVATTVVMGTSAWSAFRSHPDVKDVLDTRRGSTSTAETGPLAASKARFGGTVGDYTFWVYKQSYVDAAGATQEMLLPAEVLVVAEEDIEGVRHYGAIKDEAAGYMPTRFFAKSWLEQDPAVRWLMMQSAPIVVPYRPNASAACAGVV